MTKPTMTKSRLICEGCDKTTDYIEHDIKMPADKLMVTLLKKAGWKNDCPACEKLKKAKKGPAARPL